MRTPNAGSRGRRWLVVMISVVVLVILVYLSVRKVTLSDVVRELARVDLAILSLALLAKVTWLVLASWRARILFEPLHHFGFARLFASVLLGTAVNNAIPFRAGEVARVGYLARHGRLPASTCLAVVALERVIDMVCLSLLLILTVAVVAVDMPIDRSVYVIVGAAVTVSVAAVWVSRRPDAFVTLCRRCAATLGGPVVQFVGTQADTFARGLSALRSTWAVLAVLGVSLLIWAVATSTVQIWLWAFGLDVRWYTPMIVAVFVAFGVAVPTAPGHVGTYHFLVVAALATVGVEGAAALSVAIVGHAVAVLSPIVFAVPVLLGESLAGLRAAATSAEDTGREAVDTSRPATREPAEADQGRSAWD